MKRRRSIVQPQKKTTTHYYKVGNWSPKTHTVEIFIGKRFYSTSNLRNIIIKRFSHNGQTMIAVSAEMVEYDLLRRKIKYDPEGVFSNEYSRKEKIKERKFPKFWKSTEKEIEVLEPGYHPLKERDYFDFITESRNIILIFKNI